MGDILDRYKIGELLNQNEIKQLVKKYHDDAPKYKPCRGGNIAVIDNDKESLTVVKEVINNNTIYSVSIILRNNKHIVRTINESKPDIIIMDIYLSGINCIEDIIKNHPNIHILIISNQSYKPLIIQTLKLGATNFILKPIEKSFLADAINQIPRENTYSNQRYRRPRPIQTLTEKIFCKTRLQLNLILELWRINPWNHYEFFSQIWKDKDGIYSIVYIDSPLCRSYKDIVTLDILIKDGKSIEKLLSKGIFKLFSYGEYKTLNTSITFIRPFIYNDKNLFYGWEQEPEDKEFKIIESIICKYVDSHR